MKEISGANQPNETDEANRKKTVDLLEAPKQVEQLNWVKTMISLKKKRANQTTETKQMKRLKHVNKMG